MTTCRSDSTLLKFVRVDESAEEHLRRAAKAATKAELDLVWISASDVQKQSEGDRSVFVVDPFEGDHFEYLKQHKYRVCGPQCVLSCIQLNVPLPNSTYPIYSISMRGVFACCTSVPSKERQRLHDYIHMMAGIVIRDFTDSVTHLIAGEVGSKKYTVASTLNKPIMLPKWVYTLWEEGKTTHVNATDSVYDRFKCPILKGCTICVSGLEPGDRIDVKNLCKKHGGVYSGELNMNTCTHLIVDTPRGEKYVFARKWNIHCVSKQWFDDCIKSGYWLEEASYRTLLEDEQNISQLGSRLSTNLMSSTILTSTRIEECSTTAAQAAYRSAQQRSNGGLTTESSKQRKGLNSSRVNTTGLLVNDETKPTPKLDDMDLDLILTPGSMFLDGCKIFLSGFSGSRLDKLRKIINSGGGTRFNIINEIVSHVVIGTRVSKDVQLLKDSELQPHVVTVDWIVDSAKSGTKLPEEGYIHPEFRADTEESASCKENKQPAVGTRNVNKDLPATKNDYQNSTQAREAEDLDNDDLLLQYMSKVGKGVADEQKTESKSLPKKSDAEDDEDEDVTLDDKDEDGQGAGLLSGKTFVIENFAEENISHLQKLIEEHGGRVVESSSDKMAAYCVLPMNVRPGAAHAHQMVSFCWLETCLQDGQLMEADSSFLFRPFVIPDNALPLDKCVITISQYNGVKRDHMMQLAELLGAQCQEFFVRKANGRHKVSTHLICQEPEGGKYTAALKWNIPATTCNWLFACAKTGSLLPVEDFPVLGSEGDNIVISPQKMEVPPGKPSTGDVQNQEDEDEKDATDGDTVFDTNIKAAPIAPEGQISKFSGRPPHFGNKAFRPSFDLSDAMEALASPLVPSIRSRKSRGSRNSFPLDDFFQDTIIGAIQRTGEMKTSKLAVPSKIQTDGEGKAEGQEQMSTEEQGILYGVILAVSKKFAQQQTELYSIASSLGADYRWVFDPSCTHLIHQGRANDNTKEYTTAKEHGIYIVSPHWLHTCAQEGQRVEESLYPHTYNPKLSLSVVTSGRRLTRSSKASVEDNNQSELRKPSEVESDNKTGSEASSEQSRPCHDLSQQSDATEDEVDCNDPAQQNAESVASHQSAHATEDFQKQLEDFMVATKAAKGRRRSRRKTSTSSGPGPAANNSSTSSTTADGDKRMSLSTRRTSTRLRTRVFGRDGDKSLKGKGNKQQATEESEQSQSDTITYDDPAGRLEREKIMAQLHRGCSPSPDNLPDDDDYLDNDANELANEVSTDKSKDSSTTSRPVATESALGAQLELLGVANDAEPPSSPMTQTPEPPPVAFQVKEVEKPEPQNLLEDQRESSDEPPRAKVHKFQLSAMTPQEKTDYSALIEQLGGHVFESMYFNPDCTHVVVGNPNRNEKYLGSLAMGKWVLHKSYLEASREAGCFVSEALHEWGVEIPGEAPNKLGIAARRWRMKLAQIRKTCTDPPASIGAFMGWVAFLCVDKSRQPGFKRLLEAGGARVASSRPPYTNTEGVTHAFVDTSKLKSGVLDVASLHSAGIFVVKPEYIGEFLSQDTPPNASKYLIPEAAKLRQVAMDTSLQRKRKGDDLAAEEKRARLE